MTVDAPAVAIFDAIQRRLRISFAEIVTRSQAERETHARYLAMSLLREAGWTNERIGKLLRRDRTLVKWACRCVYREPAYVEDLPALREMLGWVDSEPSSREAAP